MIRKVIKHFLPLLSLWLTLGCTEKEVGSYYQSAQPILAAHCNGCHGDADVAPFSFETYEDAKGNAQLIASVLRSHTMPPFPPRTELTRGGCASGQDCRELADPRAISKDDHEALLRWAEGGTPEGTVPTSAPPDTFTRKAEEDFGPATQNLDISSEFIPDPGLFETYRCFVVDPGWDVPTHVRGVAVAPDVRSVIHHSTVYVQSPEHTELVDGFLADDDIPGYDCLNGSGLGFRTDFLLNYAPGARAYLFPGDSTREFAAGTRFVIQMHYNYLSGVQADESRLLIWQAEQPAPKSPRILMLRNINFVIPAGADSYTVEGISDVVSANTTNLGQTEQPEGYGWSIFPHMHELGSAIQVDVLRANGDQECLLDVPKWDFYWQGHYWFKDPVKLYAGDRVRVTCTWDNSRENQVIVNGRQLDPQDRGWGEGTLDEMCLGFLVMTNF